ncbi:MAG: hypothetical protein WC390_10185 [Sulfurimonas sp.]|jgi:hypothetical protein
MSTSCNIVVADEDNAICLYKQSDGYPDGESGIIAGIKSAMKYAWPLPRFEAGDFAAALVRGMKEPGGGGIYIEDIDILDDIYPPCISDYTYNIRRSTNGDSLLIIVEDGKCNKIDEILLYPEIDNSTAPCESEP